jgi:hypothetical protein
VSDTLRQRLGTIAAGCLLALATAGCSGSPPVQTTSTGATTTTAVAPSLRAWYSAHLTTVRTLSTEFTALRSAVTATSTSPDSADLAALHKACAALLESAAADAALRLPAVALRRTWETAIRLVGTGSAECVNGIPDIRSPVLEEGIARLGEAEHDLAQILLNS